MMPDFSVRIDTSHAVKALGALRLEGRQRAAMGESLAYLQSEVRAGMPVDLGIGRGSVFTETRGSTANLRGRAGSSQIHVSVLEKGRRPGAAPPPVGPIASWLSRHGGNAEMAFVVARSIGRRGTKPHHMFRNAIERGKGRIESIWRKHFNL